MQQVKCILGAFSVKLSGDNTHTGDVCKATPITRLRRNDDLLAKVQDQKWGFLVVLGILQKVLYKNTFYRPEKATQIFVVTYENAPETEFCWLLCKIFVKKHSHILCTYWSKNFNFLSLVKVP